MISCFDKQKTDEKELHSPREYSQGLVANENVFSKSFGYTINSFILNPVVWPALHVNNRISVNVFFVWTSLVPRVWSVLKHLGRILLLKKKDPQFGRVSIEGTVTTLLKGSSGLKNYVL